MKANIKDFTFLIPVRLDSIVRLENLLLSVRYLLKEFETQIMILEASSYKNKVIQKLLNNKSVDYLFIEDKDPVFYRTKYLNIMTRKAGTPFVGVWDSDVIINKKQILDSIQKLRDGYDIAYPYDGHFYDTSEVIRELYIQKPSIKTLEKHKNKMHMIYGPDMKGGAMFANKESYINAGMENEAFYGWGPEDFERYERWLILEYKIHRNEGDLFHLTHARGINSTYRSMDQAINTNYNGVLTKMSSKAELQNTFLKPISDERETNTN